MIVVESEIIARTQTLNGGGPPDTGEVLVTHNDGEAAYQVFTREPDETEARLCAAFHYNHSDDDDESLRDAFRQALHHMTALALEL